MLRSSKEIVIQSGIFVEIQKWYQRHKKNSRREDLKKYIVKNFKKKEIPFCLLFS